MHWSHFVTWIEICGGCKPLPEAWQAKRRFAILRALWWLALLLLALAFAGRTTKFIYVDF